MYTIYHIITQILGMMQSKHMMQGHGWFSYDLKKNIHAAIFFIYARIWANQ